MKFARPLIMYGIIIGLFISCATRLPIADAPIFHPLENISFKPIVPLQSDTIKADTLPKKATPDQRDEYDKLINKTNIQPIISKDSIISLNYQWQKAYLRVVNRKIRGDDSLKNLIIEQGKKADAYYQDAKKASYYVEQTKHAETTSNWVFFTGFGMLITFMILNTFQLRRIKKQTA